jgi:hypothetical protein
MALSTNSVFKVTKLMGMNKQVAISRYVNHASTGYVNNTS